VQRPFLQGERSRVAGAPVKSHSNRQGR